MDHLASPVVTGMFRDRAPVLANDDAIRVCVDLDRPSNSAGVH
jgi:hypothetical protein